MKGEILYRGKPVDDLTREELISALKWSRQKIKNLVRERAHERQMLGLKNKTIGK